MSEQFEDVIKPNNNLQYELMQMNLNDRSKENMFTDNIYQTKYIPKDNDQMILVNNDIN